MFDRKEYEGKRALRRWPKWLPVVAALALATAVTVGGTLAWLSAHTNSVTNTFTMGDIVPQVSENLTDDTKSDITVTNNGSVEAYVRVALVFSWRDGATAGSYKGDEKPDGTIVAGTPKKDVDYTLTLNSEKWVLGSDGYYYYTDPVGPGETTKDSLCTIKVVSASTEAQKYNLDVQVLADSIQAKPTNAVTTMWGTENNGSVAKVNSDGTLDITKAS